MDAEEKHLVPKFCSHPCSSPPAFPSPGKLCRVWLGLVREAPQNYALPTDSLMSASINKSITLTLGGPWCMVPSGTEQLSRSSSGARRLTAPPKGPGVGLEPWASVYTPVKWGDLPARPPLA